MNQSEGAAHFTKIMAMPMILAGFLDHFPPNCLLFQLAVFNIVSIAHSTMKSSNPPQNLVEIGDLSVSKSSPDMCLAVTCQPYFSNGSLCSFYFKQ